MSNTTLPPPARTGTALAQPWYRGVTRYQWLVLIIASLGWVFDAFEGQLYNITRGEMLPDLLRTSDPTLTADAIATLTKSWGERFLGIFLIGGTLGGWIFSSLADRWGRMPVMAITILFYSIFSGLTALATELWHVGALRFLVAMGVVANGPSAPRWWPKCFPSTPANAPAGSSTPPASPACGSPQESDFGSARNGGLRISSASFRRSLFSGCA